MKRSHDWLAQAQRDAEHARHALAGGFYEWACFSAQQSAEKAVKAAFQVMGAEAWGHSVSDLLSELNERQPVREGLLEAALELDKAYIPARYPDAHPSGFPGGRYTRSEARRLIGHAEAILAFCEGLLSQMDQGGSA